MWIFCRHLMINRRAMLQHEGPLIIASNHPNSFLDAIILSTLFRKPVHSLARGDAFKNKFIGWLLRSIHMLPVYRTSEGVENLEHNYTTFEACKQIFKQNGIVLIFSEGQCVNEWHLRPLKKGTARLAISSWEEGIDVKILPCGLNYQSFRSFGKNIQLNFGDIFSSQVIDLKSGYGKSINGFNEKLRTALKPLVSEIDEDDSAAIKKQFIVPVSPAKKILLAIPAVLGYLIHFPLYFPLNIIIKKTGNNDHHDSIVVGSLFCLYIFYLLIICMVAGAFGGVYMSLLALILLPFCAWSYVQLKKQF